MRICTLASSSSGNCTLVSYKDTNILIDAGISMRRITKSLAAFGLTPEDVSGILVTHEHSDHIGGIGMMVKHHKTPVLASKVVCREICKAVPGVEDVLSGFEAGDGFMVGDIPVKSFLTMHDTPESVGYRFDGDATVLFATDLGSITREILDEAKHVDMAIIEANHDVELLKNGAYPYFLKKRILSEHGHLSNDDSGSFAKILLESGVRRIVLAHLSRENNTPRLALETVGRQISASGAVVGRDVKLDVAPPDGMSEVYIM